MASTAQLEVPGQLVKPSTPRVMLRRKISRAPHPLRSRVRCSGGQLAPENCAAGHEGRQHTQSVRRNARVPHGFAMGVTPRKRRSVVFIFLPRGPISGWAWHGARGWDATAARGRPGSLNWQVGPALAGAQSTVALCGQVQYAFVNRSIATCRLSSLLQYSIEYPFQRDRWRRLRRCVYTRTR